MKLFSLLASLLILTSCTNKSQKEVWIYTSTYREVLALYEPGLQKAFPDVKIQWFQAGSENVASKLQAELAGGKPQADLVMTSDLFFFQELKKQGQLLTLSDSKNIAKLPANAVDPDRAFAVSRYPVMVLAWNEKLPEKDRPKSFKDLLKPELKGKLTMPSPMESGSALTAVMFLHKMFGDSFFKDLRANDMLAGGGNGAAMARLQSGERLAGLVLMENILQAQEKGLKSVQFTIPSEGALPIPSPMAVLKGSDEPALAQQVFDWFLSDEAQATLIKGWVYSGIEGSPAPAGAPAWNALKMASWDLPTFQTWSAERQKVKDLFQQTVLSQ